MTAPLVGIDIIDPQMLADAIARNERLRDTLFLPGEIVYADSQFKPILHLAARFAAKEAVVKALGLKAWDPLEIEVTDGGERVGVRLHGDARRHAETLGLQVSISMTHIDVLAGAIALASPAT